MEINENIDDIPEKKIISKNTKENVIQLSRNRRIFIFILIILFNISSDFESGIISICAQSYKKDLNINDIQYGLFISIGTIGKIIGLIISMALINLDKRKLILILTMILCGLSQIGYLVTKNIYLIIAMKMLFNMSINFSYIYTPVWIDQFSLKKYKTIFITISDMIGPYGRIIGCFIGSFIFKDDWLKSLVFSGFIPIIISFLLSFMSQDYFSSKYMYVELEKVLEKNPKLFNSVKEIKKQKEKFVGLNLGFKKVSSFFVKCEEYIPGEKLVEIKTVKNQNNNSNSLFSKLSIALSNGCFLFSALTKACTFGIFTIIHSFLKMYCFNGLSYKDEKKYLYYYSIVCLIAPTIGTIIGGTICFKLGGYESSKSTFILIIFGFLCAIFITYIRLTKSVKILFLNIFGYFFSISAINPTITGYIMTSLPHKFKGFGSSLDSLITTLFAKLPLPILYGFLNDKYGTKNKRLSWNYTLSLFYIEYFFIFCASLFRCRLDKKDKLEKKENIVKGSILKNMKIARSVNLFMGKLKPKIKKNEMALKNIKISEVDDTDSEDSESDEKNEELNDISQEEENEN